MNRLIFMLIAFVAGAILPIQAAFNSKMGKITSSSMVAAFVSFVVGTIAIFIYLLITKTNVNIQETLRQSPWYIWFAGFLGCFYVASTIFLLPRLGVALTFGLVIFGQLVVAMIVDHYGLFGAIIKPINIYRIAGVMMLIGGVILIRKY